MTFRPACPSPECGLLNDPDAEVCADCGRNLGHRKAQIDGGYRVIFWPGHPLARRHGYVSEHRLVAYEAGLPVTCETVIHHKNGDRLDNRLENLEVLTPSEHSRLHWAMRKAVA